MANESNLKKKRKGKGKIVRQGRGTSCIVFCFEIPCGNHSCLSEKSGEKEQREREKGERERTVQKDLESIAFS